MAVKRETLYPSAQNPEKTDWMSATEAAKMIERIVASAPRRGRSGSTFEARFRNVEIRQNWDSTPEEDRADAVRSIKDLLQSSPGGLNAAQVAELRQRLRDL